MDEPVVILCPTCGAECTSDATFCGTCGSALEQAATGVPNPATAFVAEPAPIETEAPTIPEFAAVPEPLAPPAAAPVAGMTAPAEAAPTPTSAADPGSAPAPEAAADAPATATRRCNWCGAESSADAQRCTKCGAMFPTPETDAAYSAAAEERIRSVQESLDQMRRTWNRRGFGRLFDN